MDLYFQILNALQTIPDMDQVPFKRPITVQRPSWEVVVNGFEINGKATKQRCIVRVWAGLDDNPAIEVLLGAACLKVFSVLESNVDCGLFAGEFRRLPPYNPVGLKQEFAAAELMMVEA